MWIGRNRWLSQLAIGVSMGLMPCAVVAEHEAQSGHVSASSEGVGAAATLDGLEAAINQMLTADGRLREPGREASSRLSEHAVSCSTAAASTDDKAQRLRAGRLRMRVYHALAQEALAAGHASQASYRLTQLRSAVARTQRIYTPDAQAAAAYWLMLADIADLARNRHENVARELATIERLEAYRLAVDELSVTDETAAAQSAAAAAALAQLYGQIGRHRDALVLLDALEASGYDDGGVGDAIRAAAGLCEQPAPVLRGQTAGGEPWVSPWPGGSVVVLAVDGRADAAAVRALIEQTRLGLLLAAPPLAQAQVIVVAAGPRGWGEADVQPALGPDDADTEVISVADDAVSVLPTLPCVMVVDEMGVLRAIASSTACVRVVSW